MFFVLDFISFLVFFWGGGLVERKQRLKVILILTNHGYKQYTNLLLTVAIEDVNFMFCILNFRNSSRTPIPPPWVASPR